MGGMDSYHLPSDKHLRKPILLLRVRDVFATGPRQPMILISPGQYFTTILPNKLPVRIEHHVDGSWWLLITNLAVYRLVPIPQPRPKRVKNWSRSPVQFFILDHTGQRVRNLYARQNKDGSVDVGSRHELRINYRTDRMPPHIRRERRLSKLFASCPGLRFDVLDTRNSIFKLMRLRPYRMRRRDFMRLCIAARHGLRGDALEEETTATLMAYDTRPANRNRQRLHYHRTLFPINEATRRARRWQIEHSEPPPLPLSSRDFD
jgi:hypothetical protein